MVEWERVPDPVVQMAQEIIDNHHPGLVNARIGLLFRSKAIKGNGRKVLGAASKVGARWQPVLDEPLDFIIWLAADAWLDELTLAQQKALLDHELCHCYFDPFTGEAKLRSHDVEEFVEVIERHGLWEPALERVAEAVKQLPLIELEQHSNGRVVALEPIF
jgi:hypothetical protein